MAQEAGGLAPVAHGNQDDGERDELADLDADIEGKQVRDQPVFGNVVFEDLGRETKPMEQAEDQRCHPGVRLEAEPALERTEIVERLVDDRKPDDGIDQIGADIPAEVDAEQHRGGMADGKQADIERNVLQPVEEEDHAEQEEQMVVACDHVLGAQIDEGDDVNPRDLLDIALVAFGHGMRGGLMGKEQQRQAGKQQGGDDVAGIISSPHASEKQCFHV